ncbi:MAG TPA: hypothetical protein VKR06_08005 [Ktedonosporobacter sp.]|nr:hypothetical protein [Ktedonosporobacter sp.]
MQEPDNRLYNPQGQDYDQVPFPAAPDAFANEQTTQLPEASEHQYAAQPSDGSALLGADSNVAPAEPSAYFSGTTGAQTIAPKKGRRGLWITLASLLTVLLLSVGGFFAYLYISRSTPVKTLDGFCQALQQGNYQQAYSAFSKKFQGALSEPRFADVLSQDKVVKCTYGTTNEASNSMTTDLKLVHNSHGINNDIVTLVKDETNTWKISDVRKQA